MGRFGKVCLVGAIAVWPCVLLIVSHPLGKVSADDAGSVDIVRIGDNAIIVCGMVEEVRLLGQSLMTRFPVASPRAGDVGHRLFYFITDTETKKK